MAKGTKDNLKVVKGSCDQLDETSPINVSIGISYVTSNSIVIVMYSQDPESGIKQYHYSLDGTNYKTSKNPTVEIAQLESGKTYKVYVKVENNNGIISEVVEKEITTLVIENPVYSIDKTGWATQKVVTITYPARQSGFVYQYSINGGSTWTTVSSGTTATITFTSNGSVIARVYDGINYKIGSTYTVSQVDSASPTITAKGSSYTITQGDSNEIKTTYFTINTNVLTPGTYELNVQ